MTVRDGAPGQQRMGGGSQLGQMSPADRRILQMLMLSAVHQGAATPETANRMTFEELLQQFGVEQHHGSADDGRGRTGATPERIDTGAARTPNDVQRMSRRFQVRRRSEEIKRVPSRVPQRMHRSMVVA